MNILIREAEGSDAESLLTLINEMAESQGDTPTLTSGNLQANLEDKTCRALLAIADEETIAYAAWNKGFHTYDGPFIYIDDIFVSEPYRKQDIGSQLLAEIANIATKAGCRNIEWLVAKDNGTSLQWAEKLGSKTLDRYQYRRLPASMFTKLTQK